jgi:putative addiction module component (TIGR02574 family)
METVMATSVEALEAEVLRLSPADRARLLTRLISSLDTDAEIDAAWDAIADTREAELDSGKVESVPFEEAVARLEARFPG